MKGRAVDCSRPCWPCPFERAVLANLVQIGYKQARLVAVVFTKKGSSMVRCMVRFGKIIAFAASICLAAVVMAGCAQAGAAPAGSTVDMAYVQQNLGSIDIVDTCPYDAYAGNYDSDDRTGHIPGAINIPIEKIHNRDGQLIEESRLERMFKHQGLEANDRIVVYGDESGDVSTVAQVLESHGFANVSIYEGGYSEWAADEANEVQKKPASCCAVE